MKYIGLLFIFFCFCAEAQDCGKYKTGVFEVDNMDGTVSVIKRTKKYQIESNRDIKTKDRIVWLSDCSYKLIPIKIKDKSGKIGNEVLTFTFVKINDHSYEVEITGLGNMVIPATVYEKGHLPKTNN